MSITLYVEGQGTIFAEYDGYKSSELIEQATKDRWILWDDTMEDWFITTDAWEQGIRIVGMWDMDDNGKPYFTLIANEPEIENEEDKTMKDYVDELVDQMNKETVEMPSTLEVIMALANMEDDNV